MHLSNMFIIYLAYRPFMQSVIGIRFDACKRSEKHFPLYTWQVLFTVMCSGLPVQGCIHFSCEFLSNFKSGMRTDKKERQTEE